MADAEAADSTQAQDALTTSDKDASSPSSDNLEFTKLDVIWPTEPQKPLFHINTFAIAANVHSHEFYIHLGYVDIPLNDTSESSKTLHEQGKVNAIPIVRIAMNPIHLAQLHEAIGDNLKGYVAATEEVGSVQISMSDSDNE